MNHQLVLYPLDLPPGILQHPHFSRLSSEQVSILARFLSFLGKTRPTAIRTGEIVAFAHLNDFSAEGLVRLEAAIRTLDDADPSLSQFAAAVMEIRHRETFGGITKGKGRDYPRRVSVPPEALPGAWQEALADMGAGFERGIPVPAPTIRTRIQNRLCMFAWSAERAGRPVDLGDLEARRAFHADLRARSAAKNGGVPRFAYLRNAFEELERFARYCGYPGEVIEALRATMSALAAEEAGQRPKKWQAIDFAPSRGDLRRLALETLTEAKGMARPHLRHANRNIALALALSCYDPARPADFVQHRFGETVTWDDASKCYRLRYTPQTTRGAETPAWIDALLPDWMSQFFDAALLQDMPDTCLAELREKATRERRPLIAHYDGTPAAYGWYTRAIVPFIGTGAHAMRAIVATAVIDGTPGSVLAARELLGHKETQHLQKYLSDRVTQNAVAAADSLLGAGDTGGDAG